MRIKKRLLLSCLLLATLIVPAQLFAETCNFTLTDQSSLKLEGDFLYSRGSIPNAQSIDFDDSSWSTIRLPFSWSSVMGPYRGEIWLRCQIRLLSQRPEAAMLTLTDVADADEVFFNGQRIGHTGSFSPFLPVFSEERYYLIPASLWQDSNVIAIHVYGSSALSGFRQAPELIRSGFSETAIPKIKALDGLYLFQSLALSFSWLYLLFALFFLVRSVVTLRHRENLIFATFCALLGFYQQIRNGFRYEYFEQFIPSFTAELLLLIPLPYLFYEFLIAWTSEVRNKYVLYLEAVTTVLWIFTALIPFLPVEKVTTLLHLSMYINLLMLTLGAISIGIFVRKSYEKHKDLLKYTTIGFLVLVPFVIHDMLITAGVIQSQALFVFGFPFFLGAVALHLARHQVDLEQISKRSDTERKRAERRKAEAIYNVSHEFQFHFDGIRDTLSEKSKKISNQHSLSLDRLLHDAKLLSQIENGSYDLRQSRFSIKEQADSVINQVIQVTGERSSRLKLELPAESERFWSDISLFKTCLFHIVENSVLYSNGQILIHIEVIDGNLQVSIKDEGPGISTEIQNKIFDKFFRGPGLKQPGSGIGLTLTKLAIELLDGHLSFESGPGFYTVFDFTLPEMQEVPA